MKFSASFVLASLVAVLGVTSILAAPAPQRGQRGLGRARGFGRAGGGRGARGFRGAGGGGRRGRRAAAASVEQRDLTEEFSLRDVPDEELAAFARSMPDDELALGLRAAYAEDDLEARKINWGKIGRGALKVGKFAASNFLKRDEMPLEERDLTDEELEARKINWGKIGRGALKVGKFAASNFLKRDEIPEEFDARDLTEEELEARKINWGKIGRGALKVGKFAASNFLKRDLEEVDVRDVSDADLAMAIRSLPDTDLALAVRETVEEMSPLERRKFHVNFKKLARGAMKVGKFAMSSGLV